MATGKRYYWIKLKDSFMNSDVIDFLMSQPDGANYVVLYQMLCLKTINTGGRLMCQIGDIIIPFDVEKIQRDCKWFTLDTVRVALGLYKQLGLIYEDRDGTLILSDHSDMIGSETDYSSQKRRQREKQQRQIPAQTVDKSGDEDMDIVHTDIRDKRIDIRDKEMRDSSYSVRSAADAGLAQIIGSFEDNIGSFPPAAKDALLQWRNIFTDDLIMLAIEKAALSGVRKWSYINGILKAWKNDGVKTLGDVQVRDQRRSDAGGHQPKRTAAEDYDDIFGGLV